MQLFVTYIVLFVTAVKARFSDFNFFHCGPYLWCLVLWCKILCNVTLMMHQSEFHAASVALSRDADKRKSLINIQNIGIPPP